MSSSYNESREEDQKKDFRGLSQQKRVTGVDRKKLLFFKHLRPFHLSGHVYDDLMFLTNGDIEKARAFVFFKLLFYFLFAIEVSTGFLGGLMSTFMLFSSAVYAFQFFDQNPASPK